MIDAEAREAIKAAEYPLGYCQKMSETRKCGYGRGCPFFGVDRAKGRLYCGITEGVFPWQWVWAVEADKND